MDESDLYSDGPEDSSRSGGGKEPRWSRWLANIVFVILVIYVLTYWLRGCPYSD